MHTYFDQAVAEWKWIMDPEKGPRVIVIWRKHEMHGVVCLGELLADAERAWVEASESEVLALVETLNGGRKAA